MAARKTLAHAEEVRKRIQASQLINALQNRALGKNKMDATAVNAARVLLSKVVPDLKAIEHSGSVEHDINARFIEVTRKDERDG